MVDVCSRSTGEDDPVQISHHVRQNVPFYRTQFQTSGIELRHEDAIGSDSYWSPNLPSSVMRDDNSILSFQAANKLQRDVFGQLSVDTCDAVGVQSVVTQTETPRRADAHLNTEVSMAAPDGHAEVGGVDGEWRWQRKNSETHFQSK